MRKTNYIKLVSNMIFEGIDRWWYLNNIVVEYRRLEDKTFGKLLEDKAFTEELPRVEQGYKKQFASYIPHVRKDFIKNGELLIPKKEKNKEIAYKRAAKNEKDQPYIVEEMIRIEKVMVRAQERFELNLDVVKKKGFLPESRIKQLELSLQLNK